MLLKNYYRAHLIIWCQSDEFFKWEQNRGCWKDKLISRWFIANIYNVQFWFKMFVYQFVTRKYEILISARIYSRKLIERPIPEADWFVCNFLHAQLYRPITEFICNSECFLFWVLVHLHPFAFPRIFRLN